MNDIKGANSMNEEEYLSFVKKALIQKINEIDEKIIANETDVKTMNDYFWENYTEFDEYGYEMYDNKIALIINARDHFPIDKEKLLVYKMI